METPLYFCFRKQNLFVVCSIFIGFFAIVTLVFVSSGAQFSSLLSQFCSAKDEATVVSLLTYMMATYEKLRETKKSGVNPKTEASAFSRFTFSWINGILATGKTRPLENSDLFPLLHELQSRGQTEKLEEAWNKELTSNRGLYPRGFNLFKALLKIFSWYDYAFQLSISIVNVTFQMVQPVLLSLLLSLLLSDKRENFWWVYIYGAGICISSAICGWATSHSLNNTYLLSLRWKVATVGLIFKKVLQLNQSNLGKVTSGYILNLISSDTVRFDQVVMMFELLFRAILTICGIFGVTWYLLGSQALYFFIFLLLMIIYFIAMGFVSSKLRFWTAKVTDERISITRAIVHGIRVVKMHAWEWPFMATVQQKRRKELKYLRFRSFILATFGGFLYSCQPIAVFICLVALTATGSELTFYNTFVAVSLVSSVRLPVAWDVGQPIKWLADFFAALHRAEVVLELRDQEYLSTRKRLEMAFAEEGEQGRKRQRKDGADSNFDIRQKDSPIGTFASLDGTLQTPGKGSKSQSPQVVLQDVTCFWKKDSSMRPTLNNISLSLSPPDLLLVTGPVGCGKSSLLLAILRELPTSQGTVSCAGSIAFVSQQPWIFSGTVRDNILFGQEMNRQRYANAIDVCELFEDITKFPDGDLTMIGERGVLLSGGQRSRVALARAVYTDADVYLLDDPLSAVDAKVGTNIFRKCICGALSHKACILVTHQLECLSHADHIVVMKEGAICHRGNYSDLQKAGLEFDLLETRRDEGTTTECSSLQENRLSREVMVTGTLGLETDEEDRMTGSVSSALYVKYFHAGLGYPCLLMFAVFFCSVQVVLIISDWWLLQVIHTQQKATLITYGVLVSVVAALLVIRAWIFLVTVLNSSQNLHSKMLESLLKAPVLFFDKNPTGRILNRFSKDIDCMDGTLPDTFLEAVQLALYSVGSVALPSVLNPWILLGVLPLACTAALIGWYFIQSSRELARLVAVNKSPVLSHFSDTLEGLQTIRAHRTEGMALEQMYRYQDMHTRAWFVLKTSIRWMAIRVDFLCVLFVLLVFYSAMATSAGPGLTALSVIYALQATANTTQFCVHLCSEVEAWMTSVERVITYTNLEPEPGYQNDVVPPDNWPQTGDLQVENLSLLYYSGGPEILRNVTFAIRDRERVGVVGRTGAGKSSLIAALLRMPPGSGRVVIDGVEVARLNIQSCRQAISIITQYPILFTGSLRMNLDPFNQFSDYDIWESLLKAHVKKMVETLPHQLHSDVRECGVNFSAGERQLLCLARALLKKNKIIVLDEATANVDYETDRLIQETIRDKFQECTVITIAHRLNTIMDYDKILVLEDGRVVEFDQPQVLLSKENGPFAELYRSQCAPTSGETRPC